MANLYDDSLRGTLTLDRLKRYLEIPGTDIDAPGGSKSLTPLSAACRQGHLEVVRLLLDNPYRLANPNALSPRSRTPLFYATTRSPPKNRAAIVRQLLDAGADIDACSVENGLNTPLMNAITQVRDKDVVRELVDRGASLTAVNAKGETAVTLAKGTPMESELGKKDQLSATLAAIIDVIVSVIVLIVAYTNSSKIQGVVNNIVDKLYGMTGTKQPLPVPEVAKAISEPKTVEEFTSNLDTFVKDTGLEKFFAPGDRFLQNLAVKATALRDDPTTSLGTPANLKRLTRLSMYQTVIYCDDSGSMDSDNRYQHQRELVQRIARIATKITPDNYGVELRFINASSASNLSAAQIETAMKSVSPTGGTNIGTELRAKILQPLVYNVLADRNKHLQRPLLVCIITDGHPSPEPATKFKDVIVECRRTLVNAGYEPTAVVFSVSQIGNDKLAAEFLRGLNGDPEISDVVYCTADSLDDEFKELRTNERKLDEWLLKTLTAPIMGRDEV